VEFRERSIRGVSILGKSHGTTTSTYRMEKFSFLSTRRNVFTAKKSVRQLLRMVFCMIIAGKASRRISGGSTLEETSTACLVHDCYRLQSLTTSLPSALLPRP
jgi:hypothetical protein